jgi:hypothetical protein
MSRCSRERGDDAGDKVVLDVDVEGGELATTKSGHARCLDRRWGSRRDVQQLGEAMQGTCVEAAAVLE